MCGIFGIILGDQALFTPREAKTTTDLLFQLSESRGKEASGVAFLLPEAIRVAKHSVTASDLITRRKYTKTFNSLWETAADTDNTWRIGDGTASFYNFIYHTMAGLTENDTFRSNQIREGALTREEALNLAARDNEPRYESIQWYCDVIGVDFLSTMEAIQAAPKLYTL